MFSNTRLTAEEGFRLLGARRLPGRLTTGETAVLLGFAEHDFRVLVAVGLLKPLGRPAQNATKTFASADVQTAASDPQWLSKATVAITRYWKNKNSLKAH
jgi:hypothetical protein